MKTTCLIPFYNERARISLVLEVVVRVKHITQVVCVDDGSTDGTAAFIKAHWPQVEIVQLKSNQGKAAAVCAGLKAVKNEYILMMDADLQELRVDEIEKAIHAYDRHPEIDMVILRRINSPWFVKWYRSDILLSGERILKKRDLEEVMQQQVARYQLEVAINRYMIRHHKTVRWIPWSAVNTYKTEKWGAVNGSKKEFMMYVEIVEYVGLAHMCIQLGSFTKSLTKRPGRLAAYRQRLLQSIQI